MKKCAYTLVLVLSCVCLLQSAALAAPRKHPNPQLALQKSLYPLLSKKVKEVYGEDAVLDLKEIVVQKMETQPDGGAFATVELRPFRNNKEYLSKDIAVVQFGMFGMQVISYKQNAE